MPTNDAPPPLTDADIDAIIAAAIGAGADAAMVAAITSYLEEAGVLGVEVLLEAMPELAATLDSVTITADVNVWVGKYIGALIRGVDDTTREAVRTELRAWAASGEPFDAMVARLAPMFGPERALLIAETEVTRAYSKSNLMTWSMLNGITGLGDRATVTYRTQEDERVCPICGPLDGTVYQIRKVWEFIPKHPRCRCRWEPVYSPASPTTT